MPGLFPFNSKPVVLFRTHFWDDSCERFFTSLQKSLENSYSVIATGFLSDPTTLLIPPHVTQAFHDAASLALLPYPNIKALRPHHVEPMAFFQKYPDYSHYWIVEYDVRYTGNWLELFRSLESSDADFLATIVQRRLASPLWVHWQEFCAHQPALPEVHYIKAFAPFMRLSNPAMSAIDSAYRAGWVGHFEALWPTAVAVAGLTIEDIGGDGPFTPPSRRLAHYTANPHDQYLRPGSFIFRPSILEDDIPPTPARLWHPVKPLHMQTPLPPPKESTWRDHWFLAPFRRLRRKLIGGKSPHF